MYEFDEYGHGYHFDHNGGFQFHSHQSITSLDGAYDNERVRHNPLDNISLIVLPFAVIGLFLLVYAAVAAVALLAVGILIYTLSRILLAPFSSLIDIWANWGNLYHLRSKKALQYQLLGLSLLGIGVALFCTKLFNPFSGMGTFALASAIIIVTLSIVITTAIARYYAAKIGIEQIRPLLGEYFDQNKFSDSLWMQGIFGQDDFFLPGIHDYEATFPKTGYSDDEQYTLFLREFNKLDRQCRLNIEQAEGRANFDFICHYYRKEYYSSAEKYGYLTSVAKAMWLLDGAGLLNEHSRKFIKDIWPDNPKDDLIKIYITEYSLLKKSGRLNNENLKAILDKLKNATDLPKLAKSLQRKVGTYELISQYLFRDARAVVMDYLEGDEEEVVQAPTHNPVQETKAEAQVPEGLQVMNQV
jgi:hypothetical protein